MQTRAERPVVVGASRESRCDRQHQQNGDWMQTVERPAPSRDSRHPRRNDMLFIVTVDVGAAPEPTTPVSSRHCPTNDTVRSMLFIMTVGAAPTTPVPWRQLDSCTEQIGIVIRIQISLYSRNGQSPHHYLMVCCSAVSAARCAVNARSYQHGAT